MSWKRIVAALALVFAAGMLFDFILAFFAPWNFMREITRGRPEVALTPKALQDTSQAVLEPDRIDVFGLSFQTPWKQQERRDFRSMADLKFNGGAVVLVSDPASQMNMSAALRKHGRDMEQFFGERSLGSQYDWMAAELSATPSQMHWWDLRGRQRVGVLLGLKLPELLNGTTAIFEVGNGEVRGFQLGDPTSKLQMLKIELFDRGDRRYQFLILPNGASVHQADINSIVASMRPIPQD